jgi:hypothetical protein
MKFSICNSIESFKLNESHVQSISVCREEMVTIDGREQPIAIGILFRQRKFERHGEMFPTDLHEKGWEKERMGKERKRGRGKGGEEGEEMTNGTSSRK